MKIAYQFLCILSAIVLFSILYAFNPINSNIPGVIAYTIMSLFLALISLTVKENIVKNGGKISIGNKIIGLLIILGIYGYSSIFFMAMWKGEISPESILGGAMAVEQVDSTQSEIPMETVSTDTTITSEIIATEMTEKKSDTPTPMGKAVMVFVVLVAIFTIWIMLMGGEGASKKIKTVSEKK